MYRNHAVTLLWSVRNNISCPFYILKSYSKATLSEFKGPIFKPVQAHKKKVLPFFVFDQFMRAGELIQGV